MVAAHVLDREVLVEHRGEQQPAKLDHVPLRAVDQLVRDDDAAVPGVDADEQQADQRVCAPEAVQRDHAYEQCDVQQVQRDEQV